MSYNITRRILRSHTVEFVKKFKKMNNISNKSIAKLLSLQKKEMTLKNQYEFFIELQIAEIEKNNKNQKEVVGFGEEKIG